MLLSLPFAYAHTHSLQSGSWTELLTRIPDPALYGLAGSDSGFAAGSESEPEQEGDLPRRCLTQELRPGSRCLFYIRKGDEGGVVVPPVGTRLGWRGCGEAGTLGNGSSETQKPRQYVPCIGGVRRYMISLPWR